MEWKYNVKYQTATVTRKVFIETGSVSKLKLLILNLCIANDMIMTIEIRFHNREQEISVT